MNIWGLKNQKRRIALQLRELIKKESNPRIVHRIHALLHKKNRINKKISEIHKARGDE
jgi:hypothetical protein